jgi:DNA-binding transcriptional LysR family regulator
MRMADVDNIGLELFRTFLAVNEFRSGKKAAEKLGLSPPAISGHLRRLQNHLGVKLLDDSAPGVRLTPDGAIVLQTAREIVDRHDQLISLISRSRNGELLRGAIRIGVPHELRCWQLVPILAEFRQSYPELQFALRRGSSDALLTGLHNSELDICPVVTPHFPQDAVRYYKDQVIWMSKYAEERSPRSPISIVVHPDGTVIRELMLSSLQAANVPFRITFEAADIDGAIEAVRRGFGCIALPRSDLVYGLVERSDLPSIRPAFWGIHVRYASPIIEQLADRLLTILQ